MTNFDQQKDYNIEYDYMDIVMDENVCVYHIVE